ncbi:MAG: C-terminal processing protease CtpA/Prc [Bradymonadia bacterium]|jgi:C-terminal processing protease CtpA/Prc
MRNWLVLALPLSLVACAEVTDSPELTSSQELLSEVVTDEFTIEAPTVDLSAVADELIVDIEGVVAIANVITPVEEMPSLAEVNAADRDIEFGAVGMMVKRTDGEIRIDEIMAGMPAEYAGLTAGMRVLEVDGIETTDMTLEDFVSLVRGEEGSEVTLTVAEDTADAYTVTLSRETLQVTENRCDRVRRTRNQTEFGGIGVRLGGGCSGVHIESIQDGMPAQASGLLAGDVILAVDGMALAGSNMVDVVGAIRGDAGTLVQMEVRGADGELRAIEVERVSMVVPAGGGCGE